MVNRIAVIGSSNIDFAMKMDHLPAVGETVLDAEFVQVFGGKGANQAVAAARGGGMVTFVNCVGDDPYAERMVGSRPTGSTRATSTARRASRAVRRSSWSARAATTTSASPPVPTTG